MERRLAAILAADVVSYSRLMGSDEAGTLARLEGLKAEILDPLIAQHRGRVVKLMGDGFLVEFASVVDALACALAWQDAVEARASQVPEDRAQSQSTCSRLQTMMRRTTSMFITRAMTDRVSRGRLKTAPRNTMNTLTSRPNLK